MDLREQRNRMSVLYYLGRLAGHCEALCGVEGTLSYKLRCRDLADECDDQGFQIRRGAEFDLSEAKRLAAEVPELKQYAGWVWQAERGRKP